VTVGNRRAKSLAICFYRAVHKTAVAQNDTFAQTRLALLNTHAAKRESVALASRLHVAIDQRHIIANDHRPVRLPLDDRVQDAATVANVGVVQDAVLNIATSSHMDRGIDVSDKAHLGSPFLIVTWAQCMRFTRLIMLLYKNRV
jgi:hypothetical protein